MILIWGLSKDARLQFLLGSLNILWRGGGGIGRGKQFGKGKGADRKGGVFSRLLERDLQLESRHKNQPACPTSIINNLSVFIS